MVFARLSMSSLVQCKRPNETHAVSRRLRARDLLKTMRAVHGNGNSHSDSGRYGYSHGKPNGNCYGPAASDTDAQTSSHAAADASCAVCRVGNVRCSGHSLHP